jgi:ribonuclease E
VLESSTEKCPVCGGTGHVRSVSSVALQCLRAVEEMLIKGATHNLIVRTRSEVALYMLNHKRAHLRALEERFHITITVSADPTVTGQQSYIIDRGEQMHSPEAARSLLAAAQPELIAPVDEDDEDFVGPVEESAEDEAAVEAAQAAEPQGGEPRADGEGDPRRRRRRRGRGRGRGGEPRENGQQFTQETVAEHVIAHEDHDAGSAEEDEGVDEAQGEAVARVDGEGPGAQNGEDRDGRRRRRRGRRGGRRNRHRNGDQPINGENGHPYEQHGEQGEQQPAGMEFPPLSDEDASGIAPPFHEGADDAAASPAPAPMMPPPMPETQPAPAPVAAAPIEEPMATQAPPRRRSTIREPAPVSEGVNVSSPAPVPAPPPAAPVVSSTASEEPATPKRGWWGRRLLGDKG